MNGKPAPNRCAGHKRKLNKISYYLLVFVLGLAGCLNPALPPSATTGAPPAGTVPTPVATSSARADESATTYDNPIYPNDFPDPFILPVADGYFAYSTNVDNVNVPSLHLSPDFADWEFRGDALPQLPEWAAANQSLTWAPAVLPRGASYVLYYTARDRAVGRQCIGRAVSDHPDNPFTDDSTAPLVCQVELGGSIDPSPFVDADGQAYLLWKNDGNCCNRPVGLWIQLLREDGLALTGEPVELLRRDQLWESPLIEAPDMVRHADRYYLFYSGNWWESAEYAVSYAVCATVTGPCVKPQKKPLFVYQRPVLGPGGQELFQDQDGQWWMAYHAWTAPNVGYPQGERSLRIEPVTFAEDKPVIPGPTDDPQPLP
jgi:beta-xylosidase